MDRDNADYLAQAARNAGIRDRTELANFMAQMQVESHGYSTMNENLHYSGQRLLEVFPGRNGLNDLARANQLAADGPESVANVVYGGTWGRQNLGNTEPGDGWKYHGRGFVQLTGRDNYVQVGRAINVNLADHPELAAERETAARIAIYYWESRVVSRSDQNDVSAACRDINGGTNGLADREAAFANWNAQLERGYAVETLRLGARGAAVRSVQEELGKLGYADGSGRPLNADGEFGIHTRHAVEAFQRDHQLAVDGKAGPQTLGAMHQAMQAQTLAALSLTDSRHPDHALFAQALAGVHKLDAAVARVSDQHSVQLAGAITVAAKTQGLSRIDTVVLSPDGSRSFAVQQCWPVQAIAEVATARALNTPMDQSNAAATSITPPDAPRTPHAAPRPERQPITPDPVM